MAWLLDKGGRGRQQGGEYRTLKTLWVWGCMNEAGECGWTTMSSSNQLKVFSANCDKSGILQGTCNNIKVLITALLWQQPGTLWKLYSQKYKNHHNPLPPLLLLHLSFSFRWKRSIRFCVCFTDGSSFMFGSSINPWFVVMSHAVSWFLIRNQYNCTGDIPVSAPLLVPAAT